MQGNPVPAGGSPSLAWRPSRMLPDGDAEFARLLEAYAATMYRHALRVLGNREDAEDAVQDAFFRIWKHRRSFRQNARLSTWIFRITLNASTAIRARRRDGGKAGGTVVVDFQAAPGVEPQAPPEHRGDGGDDMARLLSLLPPVEASALSLFYVEGLPYKEIADLLKIPPGSVATAIHRGKERLRKILKEHDGGAHGRV